jgi:sugar/nucleoside kinase (ribokinase family)
MSIVVIGPVGYDTVETDHGNVEDALGGSALFFALAARFFAPVSVVGVVGTDFKPDHRQFMLDRNIDLRGLEQRPGKTFRWHARYHENMNRRDTLSLELNVFQDFAPELLPDQRRCEYLFLGNIAPQLQERVLSQVISPKLVVGDTLSHWILNAGPDLRRILSRCHIITINDEEARLLAGEHNLVKAARAILAMGPGIVLIKRGEYGVLKCSREGVFAVPAYPLEEVIDPTGAGDTFAGGMMGFLARYGTMSESTLRTAVVYGSVIASFVVEKFSVHGLSELTWEEIQDRYRTFLRITDPRFGAAAIIPR